MDFGFVFPLSVFGRTSSDKIGHVLEALSGDPKQSLWVRYCAVIYAHVQAHDELCESTLQ